MASQCEATSESGFALTLKVQGFRTGRDDGNESEGKTSREEITSSRVNLPGVHFMY
jgi:hypothetical protein